MQIINDLGAIEKSTNVLTQPGPRTEDSENYQKYLKQQCQLCAIESSLNYSRHVIN